MSCLSPSAGPVFVYVSVFLSSFCRIVVCCVVTCPTRLFFFCFFFFLMIRRPPRSTLDRSSAASDVYKRQKQQFPDSNNRRGLLFDKPETDHSKASPACSSASSATFGHQGFTGTCVWADPEQNLIFIFLSNRVNPCLLYTSPSPRDRTRSRMPSSA